MSLNVTVTFTITPAPLAVANTAFTDPVDTVLAGSLGISGGVPPYTVSVSDPQDLPPGVAINADGTVTGTPTTPGTFTVSGVTVSDSTPAGAVSAAAKH